MTAAITDLHSALSRRLKRLAIRIGWMLLIWSLSVSAVGLAAWLMKLLMRSIGMAP